MKHSFLLLILLSSPLVVSQDSLQSALSKESNSSSQASNRQESINLLDINLITLKGDIQFLNQELDITNVYNEQLQRLIDSQNTEIKSLNQQIVDLDETNKRIMPLLLDMVKTLDKLLDFDYPFLLTERKDRVNNLYSLLDRSDISTSEKFRRVFEAYQIENEFGRTIEAYSDEVLVDGNSYNMEMFRMGRIGLYGRTPDGSFHAVYSKKNSQWEKLSSGYDNELVTALHIARKELPPSLINLPVEK